MIAKMFIKEEDINVMVVVDMNDKDVDRSTHEKISNMLRQVAESIDGCTFPKDRKFSLQDSEGNFIGSIQIE